MYDGDETKAKNVTDKLFKEGKFIKDTHFPDDITLYQYFVRIDTTYATEAVLEDEIEARATCNPDEEMLDDIIGPGGLLSAAAAPIVPGMSMEAAWPL